MASEFSNLLHSSELQAWRNGDISLGKMAELLGVRKQDLREHLADLKHPIIDTDKQEAIDEAIMLLKG